MLIPGPPPTKRLVEDVIGLRAQGLVLSPGPGAEEAVRWWPQVQLSEYGALGERELGRSVEKSFKEC